MIAKTSLSTVKIEGGLLPSDYLLKIAANKKDVPGLSPESYHLSPSERLTDAISASWNGLRLRWESLKAALAKLPDGDHGLATTRERFLLPLFQELGYGRLVAAKAAVAGEKEFPISHSWGTCPIHLVGWGMPIDKRTSGVAGAAKTNPHSLVQEFLNRSDSSLWGFVSNGREIRLLRDNKTLARQSFIEFNLETMFENEIFSEFVILWLVSHQSRVESTDPYDCWLEKWVKEAAHGGTRALKELRKGVELAVEELGQGFIEQPANRALLESLQNGNLDATEYFRQILRLIYRLLFLFVAEDRDLLFTAGVSEQVKNTYRKFYSMARLREVAAKRPGTGHCDLWESANIVFVGLGGGMESLGLPGLNSLLWSSHATSSLGGAKLSNRRFLSAIRNLAFIREAGSRYRIDFRNLGSEELGGIYENVLALTPRFESGAGVIKFVASPISERSETNSHYTPPGLVDCLCESALDPIIERALKSQNSESALLALKVCDPSCGSGHFLVAASRRIARALAQVRSGEGEPSLHDFQHSLRDVIGRCIYGVDLNPMAVELCKVSLWLEAMEPGKPLSFLGNKIKPGNSLLGATPSVIAKGIPDRAFEPLIGEEKKIVSAIKKANRDQRREAERGQRSLFEGQILWTAWVALRDGAEHIVETAENDLEDVQRKQSEYEELTTSQNFLDQKLVADAWCAAFVLPKLNSQFYLTESGFRDLKNNPSSCPVDIRREIGAIAEEYGFFHWQLEFPEVFQVIKDHDSEELRPGWDGGFDCVLGNPPWDRVKLQEKEWFTSKAPEIANAKNAAARKAGIQRLRISAPHTYQEFIDACRKAEGASHFFRNSNVYPLCGRGDINLYAVFAEKIRCIVNQHGRMGVVLPTGIVTDDTTKSYFQDLVSSSSLVSLFDFENKNIFPAVDSTVKFSLVTAGSGLAPLSEEATFAFFCHAVEDTRLQEKQFTMSADDIALLNPNTRTCPVFALRKEAELAKAIYRRNPVLIREADGSHEETNTWMIHFQTMYHMANDSELFRTREQLESDGWTLHGNHFQKGIEEFIPLYEGKMFHHFDHRWATPAGDATSTYNDEADKLSADFVTQPRYWISSADVEAKRIAANLGTGNLAFRDVTKVVNERTAIGAIVPNVALNHKAPIILFGSHPERNSLLLSGLFGSFIFDWITKRKIGSTSLSYFILKQIAVPPFERLNIPWFDFESRVLELTCTAWDMVPFGKSCGIQTPPFKWDTDRRFQLRCELDAAFFHVYLPITATGDWKTADHGAGAISTEMSIQFDELKRNFNTPRDAVSYVLDSFPIVKKKDFKAFHEFRTKKLVLENYDLMTQAIINQDHFKSNLSPIPGSILACHAPRFDGDRLIVDLQTYIKQIVISSLRYLGDLVDLRVLVRVYCLFLPDRRKLLNFATHTYGENGRRWVERYSQPVDARWFLPIIRELESSELVQCIVDADDVLIRWIGERFPPQVEAIETDIFLSLMFLESIPDTLFEVEADILPKAPAISLREALVPA